MVWKVRMRRDGFTEIIAYAHRRFVMGMCDVCKACGDLYSFCKNIRSGESNVDAILAALYDRLDQAKFAERSDRPMAVYKLTINGTSANLTADDPNTPLLYLLQEQTQLNGPKFGCGLGQCG